MVEMDLAILRGALPSTRIQVCVALHWTPLTSEDEKKTLLGTGCPDKYEPWLDGRLTCRWDEYLPYRSKEASGRAAEAAAKAILRHGGSTAVAAGSAFIDQPLLPLFLAPDADGANSSSQGTNALDRSRWVASTIQELKTLELDGQRKQQLDVIGDIPFSNYLYKGKCRIMMRSA